jgi:S-adenosylmethionine hydrolase
MIVTLLTDFGTADYFVAAMKGVVLGIAPGATLVDLTHEIPPQDIRAAAFFLRSLHDVFPSGSIHLAVVDPGVGSARRPIVVADRHLWVGPDNGIFSQVYERDPDARVFHATNERLFRHPVSATFQGRDVFAPLAGALAAGLSVHDVGREIHDPVRLPPPRLERLAGGALGGEVVHVDRFGNCITSFPPDALPADALLPGFRLVAGRGEIGSLRRFYQEAGDSPEPFAIWGSAGLLEIVVNCGSAAERLGLERGSPITLHPTPR